MIDQKINISIFSIDFGHYLLKKTCCLTARLQRGLLDLILDSRNHHVHPLRQKRMIASGHESFDHAHCFTADRSY